MTTIVRMFIELLLVLFIALSLNAAPVVSQSQGTKLSDTAGDDRVRSKDFNSIPEPPNTIKMQATTLSVTCATNGGSNCCSLCVSTPCTMTFSMNVTFIGIVCQ